MAARCANRRSNRNFMCEWTSKSRFSPSMSCWSRRRRSETRPRFPPNGLWCTSILSHHNRRRSAKCSGFFLLLLLFNSNVFAFYAVRALLPKFRSFVQPRSFNCLHPVSLHALILFRCFSIYHSARICIEITFFSTKSVHESRNQLNANRHTVIVILWLEFTVIVWHPFSRAKVANGLVLGRHTRQRQLIWVSHFTHTYVHR